MFNCIHSVISVSAIILAIVALVRQPSSTHTSTTPSQTSPLTQTSNHLPLNYNNVRKNSNTFYAGYSSCQTIVQSILGPPVEGSLDSYDEVCAALTSYGSVMVHGKVFADDLILKVGNNLFSLRQLLDLGTTVYPPSDTTAQDARDEAYSAPLPTWSSQLCTDARVLGGTTCPWRRNFGVDSCDNTLSSGLCVCGGGWLPYSSILRYRHYACAESARFEDCKASFYTHAPTACSPLGSEPAPVNDQLGVWVDTYVDCNDAEQQDEDMCAQADTVNNLDVYQQVQNDALGLEEAREEINAHIVWSVTRDPSYLGEYYVQLDDNIWRDCLTPRLGMLGLSTPRAAVWTCEPESAATLRFVHDREIDRTGQHQGATYYAIVESPLADNGNQWCLGVEEGDPQVLKWLPSFTRVAPNSQCTSFYLGGRMEIERAPVANLGRNLKDDGDFRVHLSSAYVVILPTSEYTP